MKKQLSTSLIALAILFELAACTKPTNQDPAVSPSSTSGWQRVSTLPATKISLLQTLNDTIYAVAAPGALYFSANNGTDWKQSNTIKTNTQITALTVYKGAIYVGTQSDGIFRSHDKGDTWINENSQILQVSSFTVFGGHLFCSSRESGWIFNLNENPDNWSPYINKGMPTNNSFNVEKVLVVNQTLFSVQGTNGAFYTFDQAQGRWDEQYYRAATYTPGLKITDVLVNNEELYAANSLAIFRSENGGSSWTIDTVGLKRGGDIAVPRIIFRGSDDIYTVLSGGNHESWIQERDNDASIGSTWKNNEQHLSFGYSYGYAEVLNTVYLATETGLYFRTLSH